VVKVVAASNLWTKSGLLSDKTFLYPKQDRRIPIRSAVFARRSCAKPRNRQTDRRPPIIIDHNSPHFMHSLWTDSIYAFMRLGSVLWHCSTDRGFYCWPRHYRAATVGELCLHLVSHWGVTVWTANSCDIRYVTTVDRLFTHRLSRRLEEIHGHCVRSLGEFYTFLLILHRIEYTRCGVLRTMIP